MNSTNNHYNSTASIVAWQYLHQELTALLPEQIKSQMSQREKRYAEGEKAKTRINDLTPLAKRNPNPETKKIVNILVGLISAITFSAGARILTSGMGSMSIPASLFIGGAAGVVADKKVMKVMEHSRKKNSTQQALQDIQKQKQAHPPKNEFGELYYESQTALVLQVEGQFLDKLPFSDVGLALGLSGTEYAMSLGIVIGLGLPGGIVLNAIAASLPVVMLWGAASLQNDAFEMPGHARSLIGQYESSLPQEITEIEASQISGIDEEVALKQRELAYEQALNLRREKFISEGDTSGRLKNWDMVEADFQIGWHLTEKHQIEKEQDEKREQRYFKYKADVAQIAEKYEPPAGTYSPEQMTQLKSEWVEVQEQKLKESFAHDIQWLNHKYGNKIDHCEAEIATARQRYAEAESRWREERDLQKTSVN
ncbi:MULTISPECIES: hypothetical protein [unclassified Microcoleus]|uniref:hypothetical protein n=1 Tax=unclassified Microcoleus TaxID=2642155 RepID=UPI0025F3FCFF|nr:MULTISPECIES: hypothetical protein [unclassified Microcoleus]